MRIHIYIQRTCTYIHIYIVIAYYIHCRHMYKISVNSISTYVYMYYIVKKQQMWKTMPTIYIYIHALYLLIHMYLHIMSIYTCLEMCQIGSTNLWPGKLCTSLPGQRFVEPPWNNLVQHKLWPGNLVQACRVKVFFGTKLVHVGSTKIDQTSLCKLAG